MPCANQHHSLSCVPAQWLDSLPADQLAQLAALEVAPTGAVPPAGGSGSGTSDNSAAPSGPKGAVRRNNSSNGSNTA